MKSLILAGFGALILSGLSLTGFPQIQPSQANAQTLAAKPIALIYSGPGSCANEPGSTGCTEAARAIAESAGFEVRLVGPKSFNESDFKAAAVWVQPGGRAKTQQAEMVQSLKDRIVKFVADGGGYVGFCAGGFMATESFGWEAPDGPFEVKGLGLLKGKSAYYESFDKELDEKMLAKIIRTKWNNKARDIYWELGPYFKEETFKSTEVIAFYPVLDGDREQKALALRSTFGNGRVIVSATHPEAPADWFTYYRLKDADGLDFDLAQEMIAWAVRK